VAEADNKLGTGEGFEAVEVWLMSNRPEGQVFVAVHPLFGQTAIVAPKNLELADDDSYVSVYEHISCFISFVRTYQN